MISKKQVIALGASFQDEGYKEYEEIIDKIGKSIRVHLEDVKNLQDAINAYARILESK